MYAPVVCSRIFAAAKYFYAIKTKASGHLSRGTACSWCLTL